MIAAQRDDRIITLLRRAGSVSAHDLASSLAASPATIRRDLERLERQGRLVRVHGGATLPSEATGESPFADVIDQFADEKDAIAAAAASLVADGDVALLDIGTTTMRIARHLAGRPVCVVTTNLAVLDALRDDDLVEVVLLGGTLRRNFQSLVGPIAEESLRSVRADIAFLSCTGIRPDGSVVDDISQEASLKRGLLASADRSVLVAASSKFPGTGSLRIAQLSQIGALVTTSSADPLTLAHAEETGMQVIVT